MLIIVSSDFNGRQIDLLWQNSSGEVAVWEINGTSVIGSASLANPGRAWHV